MIKSDSLGKHIKSTTAAHNHHLKEQVHLLLGDRILSGIRESIQAKIQKTKSITQWCIGTCKFANNLLAVLHFQHQATGHITSRPDHIHDKTFCLQAVLINSIYNLPGRSN